MKENATTKLQTAFECKKITVILRHYSTYYSQRYSAPIIEHEVLKDTSEKKVEARLNKLNEKKRTRFYEAKTFNLNAKFFREVITENSDEFKQIAYSHLLNEANEEAKLLIVSAMTAPLHLEEIQD